jgi:hypothetical protein
VISLETGEHIEPQGTEVFVDNICNSLSEKGFILFSAPPSGQGGSGHINCQPKSFWIDEFKNQNVKENKNTTKSIILHWESLGAPDYICKNLIVFEF